VSIPEDKELDAWEGGIGGPETLSADEKRNHPASRPGTDRHILWRGEFHRVSRRMRCLVCGWYRDEFYGRFCACGADNWLSTSPSPLSEEELWLEWTDGTGGPENLSAAEKRNHPASKPGTGQRVAWGTGIHIVSRWIRCMVCGWYKDEFYGGLCACGAENWLDTSPSELHEEPAERDTVALKPRAPDVSRTEEGPRTLGTNGVRRLIVDQYPGSAIAVALGGIARGMVVMLVAPRASARARLPRKPGTPSRNRWVCASTGWTPISSRRS
jgi:hypothetical protein